MAATRITVTIATLIFMTSTSFANDTIPIKSHEVTKTTSSPSVNETLFGKRINRVGVLMDNVNYTSWAGRSDKDGTWLRYSFQGTRYLTQFEIIPGCAGSNRTYAQYSRPRQVELITNDNVVKLTVEDRLGLSPALLNLTWRN